PRNISPDRLALVADIEAQKMARNTAVEERHLCGRLQSHLTRETRVAGEHEDLPTGKPRPEHFAQRAVERFQILLLAETLAIGRIAENYAGRPLGRLEIAHVLDVKVQQMADAGGAGVRAGEIDGIAADVGPDDRRLELLLDAGASAVAHVRPELDVEIQPAHEAEAAARQAGRAIQGDPGRFDAQRAGAA